MNAGIVGSEFAITRARLAHPTRTIPELRAPEDGVANVSDRPRF
jgi:hypothetical protein